MEEKTDAQGIGFEDKAQQVEQILPVINEVDPLEIFSPQGVNFSLKGKDYTLYPLPLRKLAMLRKLGVGMMGLEGQQEDDSAEKVMRSIAETVATILDAPKEDIEFFYENLTQPMLQWIFQTVLKLSQGLNLKKA